MQELILYITQKILKHPESVTVEESADENGDIRVTLNVHPDDVGLTIGKGGKTVNALRELLKIKVTGTGRRVYLDVKPLEIVV